MTLQHILISLLIPFRLLLRKHLAAQIKHRQRARNTNSLARRQNSQVPAANQPDEAKSAGKVQQPGNVLHVCFRLRVSDAEVCRCDEREQHDETEEREREEKVYAEGADEENEAGDCPALVRY